MNEVLRLLVKRVCTSVILALQQKMDLGSLPLLVHTKTMRQSLLLYNLILLSTVKKKGTWLVSSFPFIALFHHVTEFGKPKKGGNASCL